MSVTPRINALWSSSGTEGMAYFDRGDEESAGLVADAAGLEGEEGCASDARTPLDKTIDRIGMGAFAMCCSETLLLMQVIMRYV